jgi:branched-subunit amino acid aminotransferase/4-amino-4-deoxychorismate lyase
LIEIGPPIGIPVEERTLFPEDLYTAEEVFISSTNRNVIPVTEIDGREIDASSRPVMAKLENAFSSYIRDYVEARTAASGKR